MIFLNNIDWNNLDWNGIMCSITLIGMMIMITRTLNKVTPSRKNRY